ncbi:hypothetical protein GAYE_SCF18G3856 [Galdieria yellowstonensis]|uniref:glutathione transferase n=1 Tax=Galdieria yellowstonensis TaxID=3028027 RepID=A0AAV9IF18_9RHOD|nr:hypothetical protein GAYE_SCF18G3856 [Galdieria yellowstonensis]
MSQEYQLTYFNIRGLGEPVRLLFEDNGIKYSEERVEAGEQWQKLKQEGVSSGKIPFGQMPVLRDGSMYLAQSGAILRHLARKHNLYGDTEEEKALADMINDFANDLRTPYVRMIYSDTWKEMLPEYLETAKKQLELLDKYLTRRGKSYSVSDKPCFADYNLLAMLDCMYRLKEDLFDSLGSVKQYYLRMKQRPNIAAYMQSNRIPEKVNNVPRG